MAWGLPVTWTTTSGVSVALSSSTSFLLDAGELEVGDVGALAAGGDVGLFDHVGLGVAEGDGRAGADEGDGDVRVLGGGDGVLEARRCGAGRRAALGVADLVAQAVLERVERRHDLTVRVALGVVGCVGVVAQLALGVSAFGPTTATSSSPTSGSRSSAFFRG